MLDASHNNLITVPPDTSEVTQLTELKLNNNKLKEVSYQVSICVVSLTVHRMIVFKNLLFELNFYHFIVNTIEIIFFSHQFLQLPPEMGMLKKLWNLDISGCPVEKTYQALLGEKAKKTSAVLGYLKSIKDE